MQVPRECVQLLQKEGTYGSCWCEEKGETKWEQAHRVDRYNSEDDDEQKYNMYLVSSGSLKLPHSPKLNGINTGIEFDTGAPVTLVSEETSINCERVA